MILLLEKVQKAGRSAAKYINDISNSNVTTIEINNGEGIFYTVPQKVRIENMDSKLEIFFRVKSVEKKCNYFNFWWRW